MKLNGYSIYYLKKKDIYIAVNEDGKINYWDKDVNKLTTKIMKITKEKVENGEV
jgi:hypothetical protein